MFAKLLLILALHSLPVAAQPYYTRVRGAFGVEIFGISRKGAVSAEAALGYRNRSFWNIQAGLGMINKSDFRSPTFSAALTHCIILNPYQRKSCKPHPGYNAIETYFEAGLGSFFVDRYDRGLHSGANGQQLITPSGIAGLRFNLVTHRWIYMLKVRYTPPLLSNPLASHAGIALGVGWR